MASPDSPGRNNQGSPDNIYYQRSGVPTVVICGWSHSDYNLAGVYKIANDFHRRLSGLPQNAAAIFYLESFGMHDTSRAKSATYSVVNELGLAALEVQEALFSRTRTSPKMERIAEKVDFLDGLTDEEVVARSLTDTGMDLSPGRYLLMRNLERVSQRRPFEIEFEMHSPRKVNRVNRQLHDGNQLYEQAVDRALSGDLEEAILLVRKGDYRHAKGVIVGRERGIVDRMTTLARRTTEHGPSGLVYGLVGAAHLVGLSERLKRKVGSSASIDRVMTSSNPMMPDLWQSTRRPEETSDSVYARLLMDMLLSTHVTEYFLSPQRVVDFAMSYEAIGGNIGTIVSRMSYTEIETILANGSFRDSEILKEVIDLAKRTIKGMKR